MIPRTCDHRFQQTFHNDFATWRWKYSKDLFGRTLQRYRFPKEMPEWTERVMWWSWKLMFPMWNIGCFGIKQANTEFSRHILWCFELLIILWYAKNLKCICFIWFNLKIRHDCSCVHPQMEGKMSCRSMNIDSHLFYKLRGPRQELQVSLALKALRSVCLLVENGEVSKSLVLWPSRILEISVAGRRVQVRTEGLFAEHHQVRKSLKELRLLEVGRPGNVLASVLEREGDWGGDLPGIWWYSAWLQQGLFSHEHLFIQTFKSYTLDFTLYECA